MNQKTAIHTGMDRIKIPLEGAGYTQVNQPLSWMLGNAVLLEVGTLVAITVRNELTAGVTPSEPPTATGRSTFPDVV